ncbi:MAG TPA: hypothetical protein VFE37_24920 [Chloroflexota bacterium]|nr:hypothetical protein [Chloroflexota bacterium]
MSEGDEVTQALLNACRAALAWVGAIEEGDARADINQLYDRWVEMMRDAVARAENDRP